jgi:ferrochelatase
MSKQPARATLLLVNLGTPEAATAKAVRRYLAEFLSDPRVIDLPRWLWLPLLHGVILPLRSRRSAHAYASIWTDRGSPLAVYTADLAAAVQGELGASIEVAWAMRYGQPSIASVLRALEAEGGVRRLIVLPLYPQYSATTTASVADAIADTLRGWRQPPELHFVDNYAVEPAWLAAVADGIRAHWRAKGRGERLLFSFHGLPARYVQAGDPYQLQCQASVRGIVDQLGLREGEWQLSYQSRVGREEWLRPYTEEILRELAGEGVRRLDVVCPGFAVDCLETLEEIALRGRETFLAAGGSSLEYIPALNAGAAHASALVTIVRKHLGDGSAFAPIPGDSGGRFAQESRA